MVIIPYPEQCTITMQRVEVNIIHVVMLNQNTIIAILERVTYCNDLESYIPLFIIASVLIIAVLLRKKIQKHK